MASASKSEQVKEAASSLARLAGIPSGWEIRVTADCKVYYVDHSNQATQWRHPVDKLRRSIEKELPNGWQKGRDNNGVRVYTHVSGGKMYMDPRVVVLFDEPGVNLPLTSQPSENAKKQRQSSRKQKRSKSAPYKKRQNVVRVAGSKGNDKLIPKSDSNNAPANPDVNVLAPEVPSMSTSDPPVAAEITLLTTEAPPATTKVPPVATSAEATPIAVSHSFDRHSTGMQVAELTCPPLRGRCAVITGANSGIGFETAKCLALNGVHVVMACRSIAAASDAADRIRYLKDGCRIDVMQLDLSSLPSVHRFATAFKRQGWPLHILVCNASVMGLPYSENADGVEMHFAVNHLGHFYLTRLLTPVLRRSSPSRVIVLTCDSHKVSSLSGPCIDFDRDIPMSKSSYWPLLAYNQSKLCNLLFVKQLQLRLPHVTCLAVNPGMTSTSLARHSWLMKAAYAVLWPFSKSVEQAAATVVFCATYSDIRKGAFYFSDCKEAQPAAEAEDLTLAQRLWTLSEVLSSATHLIADFSGGSWQT